MAHHIHITARNRDPLDLERLSKLLRAQVRTRQRRRALEQPDVTGRQGGYAA